MSETVTAVDPAQAAVLITEGYSVIDVRDPDEYNSGHIPGADNLPLDLLRRHPQPRLPAERILFVCARGRRSAEAAALAIQNGARDVASLEGGTSAWIQAGKEVAKRSPPAAEPASVTSAEVDDRLDPALDQLVADNLRNLRTQRKWSLDDLARMTNVSRSVLGQIELGNSSPSVAIVWKLARAFDVPFSTMLATSRSAATSVMRKSAAKRLVSPDGRFSSRALFPFESKPPVEFYELRLAPHSRESAEPHAFGTRENIIVISGQLELEVAGEIFSLDEGDAIVFAADVAHAYVNRSAKECWMNLVMSYYGTHP